MTEYFDAHKLDMDEEPGLPRNVTKALIEGMKHNDFSHWKKEESREINEFLLELGGGYRLYAELSTYYFGRPTRYLLLYNGDRFMFCFQGHLEDADDGIRLSGSDAHVDLTLCSKIDIQDYARASKDRVPTTPIVAKKFNGERIILDAYRAKRTYFGIEEEASSAPFDRDTIDGLIYATLTHNFSKLEDLNCEFDEESNEPAKFWFSETENAEYLSEVKCRVASNTGGPVRFWVKGVLSMDSDGIVIRGGDGAFTVKTAEEDYQRVFSDHPEIQTDEDYLESNPAKSYQYLAEKDIDEIRALAHDWRGEVL